MIDIETIIRCGWPAGVEWVGGMDDLVPLAVKLAGEEAVSVVVKKDFLLVKCATKRVLIMRTGEIMIDQHEDKPHSDT